MVEYCLRWRPLVWRIAFAASLAALAGLPCAASAQTDSDTSDGGHAASSAVDYSSSLDWKGYLKMDDSLGEGLPGSPSPQYGQSNGYPSYQSRWSRIALEFGAGFTAPVGNTAHGWETYGYNLKGGAGWNFNRHLGMLLEYQWNRDKIPGSTLTQLAISSGSPTPLGGNVNTWSFTLDPIIYLPVTHRTGAYITGGGGFYRKVTNFTAPALGFICYYYCYPGYFPQTVAHSSSNQGGMNIGAGFYWKPMGEESNMKFFAEVRYTWVDSPTSSPSDPYGSGTSSLIPVTFGVRF
ncbi:MAG: outer membrane beta-barrel protein [Silvibacterium sp.]|nr:outer membrane beta-barrel protein [Silvibacterium sp.]